MTNPGQNGARDIHTDNGGGGNLGGVRIYTGNTLTNPPTTAALQFYGNGHTAFGGQAYIDSGALATAAIIFRTSPSGGVAERMRITAGGNVGIGTTTPNDQLELTGNLRLPATTSTTGVIKVGPTRLLHTFGAGNVFAGLGAGNFTMTGDSNTGTGSAALASNTSGASNTATGTTALQFNTTGNFNTANGASALASNTSGAENTATGTNALQDNTTGIGNTATGVDALARNTTGNGNTATGEAALFSNTTGGNNTAAGTSALGNNTTGLSNTAAGVDALTFNQTGDSNTASGFQALNFNSTGDNNTAVGRDALQSTTSGSNNVALGATAGAVNTTGSTNTFIGFQANASFSTLTNATAIGANALVGASDSLILGANGVKVGIGTTAPESTLQVSGGYLQFSLTAAGAPLAADCNADSERGRLVIDTTNNRLYICNGATRGWDFIALSD